MKRKGKPWTKSDLQLLKRLYPNHSNKEIGNRIQRTGQSVKTKATVLGLKKAPTYKRMAFSALPPKTVKAIEMLYHTMSNHDLAKRLGISEGSVHRYRKLLGLRKENTGRFKKGVVPFTKGKKQSEFMSAAAIKRTKGTRFKKGGIPKNTLHNGAITVRKHKTGAPWLYIRISKARWQELHRYNWEQVNGKLRRGDVLRFKDGNHMNCAVDNLEKIDRPTNMRLNTIQRYPSELQQIIRLNGKLKRKIKTYAEQN